MLTRVIYKGYSVQSGHEHTLKLDFEASPDLTSIIKNDCHLGLSGCSLTAREVRIEEMLRFSIYCGQETREKTEFNQNLPLNTEVNLTEAAEIFHIT